MSRRKQDEFMGNSSKYKSSTDTLIQHFRNNINNKILILTSSFPFVFIGHIKEVIDDMVSIDVETTLISTLESRIWFVNINRIELFYIEENGGVKIPDLQDKSNMGGGS